MDSWEKIEAAAEGFDWGQPVGSDWNPCFALMEDDRFCGRAQRWAGHGPDHAHVSLAALIRALREREEKRWERKCFVCGHGHKGPPPAMMTADTAVGRLWWHSDCANVDVDRLRESRGECAGSE